MPNIIPGSLSVSYASTSRSEGPWWREPTKDNWYAFIAAWLGWTLDAFDFTVFLFLLVPIAKEFNADLTLVVLVGSLTMWMRFVGAVSAGWMADRLGRRAPLMISILWYSACNFIAGFSPTFLFLLVFRTLLGIGMGNSAIDAPLQIDHAIRSALREKKPAYIEIACNVASAPCAGPGPVSAILSEEPSDPETLRAAIGAAAEFLQGKQKPILLIGSKLRAAAAEKQAIELAEALGCAVVVMAAAKSFFPEAHAQFAGIYWGEVSAPGAREIFDWADSVVCVGTIFNDYSTVGWTAMPSGAGVLTADPHRIYLEGHDFGRIHLRDFLAGLASKVQKRPATLVEYQRIRSQPQTQQPAKPDAKLKRTEIFRQVQALVNADTTVIAETGDSWFNGIALKLPGGARFEIEMQWGSIGWAVPATFGYAVGASNRRIIALIGDGSFQLTAQEVAQMIRRKLPVIIFLINNHGYTIEVEIHDGPYNNIKNWDYAGVIGAFNAEDGHGRGLRATNGKELEEAIKVAVANYDGPTLIECIIDRDDASADLISWGRQVAKANARPPRPQ